MSSRFRSRAWGVVVGACALVVVGALIGVRLGGGWSSGAPETIWGDAREAIEYEPQAEHSASFMSSMQRLRNELPYRSSWNDDDAAFVVSALETSTSDMRTVGPEAPQAERQDAVERLVTRTFAILVASHSLGAGVEMSEAKRREIESMLTALLEHPDPYYRQHGVSAMFDAGLIQDEAIYAWVNDVATSDPDEQTRELAAFLLNRYDMAVVPDGAESQDEAER